MLAQRSQYWRDVAKIVTKNEDPEEATGFASMTIRVPEENATPLLRNSEKNGFFVRQTERA